MTGRLQGKSAIISAAGQGIGKATACAFASEGATVWAADISEQSLRELKRERPDLHTVGLDVTDDTAIKAFSNSIGAVDVLFNCVGYVHNGTILDCNKSEWDYSFDTNVKSMYHMIRAFLPRMIENGGGNIINMASAVSSLRSKKNRCVYGATKGAVIALTKSVATDFASDRIRCNAVCPTVVDTPSLRERIAMTEHPETTYKSFVAQQPLGRMGTAEDVANLVVFLASDESSFITGTTSIIDGGKLA
jgi:NAD(P)-dependent dehydrogenase (short-subunit alcohol dehydrogenase family)